jgi:hypothetical protein
MNSERSPAWPLRCTRSSDCATLGPCTRAGEHLRGDVVSNVREKVRRAQIALEWLDDSTLDLTISKPGAEGIGVPEP